MHFYCEKQYLLPETGTIVVSRPRCKTRVGVESLAGGSTPNPLRQFTPWLTGHTFCHILYCIVQDVDHLGLFLKWRCTDGASVSVKVRYSLTLIHRHDYTSSRRFTTTQRFTSAQSMLGKTRLISVLELMDVGCGFLGDSARNVIVELQLNSAVTYFEKTVDVSASSRTRKNASGVYFDTTTFQLADVRW